MDWVGYLRVVLGIEHLTVLINLFFHEWPPLLKIWVGTYEKKGKGMPIGSGQSPNANIVKLVKEPVDLH